MSLFALLFVVAVVIALFVWMRSTNEEQFNRALRKHLKRKHRRHD